MKISIQNRFRAGAASVYIMVDDATLQQSSRVGKAPRCAGKWAFLKQIHAANDGMREF